MLDVGALAVENIKNLDRISKIDLEKEFKIKFKKKLFLITFHPETSGGNNVKSDIKELLNALSEFDDAYCFFTLSNSDSGGRIINEEIRKFVKLRPENSFCVQSLGVKRYLSILALSKLVIGNSSSGITEAPTLKVPTINIGERQAGRVMPDSVFNCKCKRNEIKKNIEMASNFYFDKAFFNPFGEGKTSEEVIDILKQINWPLAKKTFKDNEINN